MRAAIFHEFGGPVTVDTVDDPACPPGGVVIRVRANGLCRSDWHGWQGHDSMVRLPHVPGHELAGTVVAVGAGCREWREGDRVTVPFTLGCGACPACSAGQHQICHRAEQPGFSTWGAFAEYVAVDRADINLVALPDSIHDSVAACLGCRFTTAFRAVIERGRLQTGEWLAVHGCGGVGLSAIMIARAAGANVVAVDIDDEALALALTLGASAIVNANTAGDVATAVREHSHGGTHLSLDALGHRDTCVNAIRGLRRQGRHVQAGLFGTTDPDLPMDEIIGRELEILGTHGMAAHRFPPLFDMIADGRLEPARLIARRITLDEVPDALMTMATGHAAGITVMELG